LDEAGIDTSGRMDATSAARMYYENMHGPDAAAVVRQR
jgi:hypothetical protein